MVQLAPALLPAGPVAGQRRLAQPLVDAQRQRDPAVGGAAATRCRQGAAAAMRWCKHASDHAANVGTKPWKYLLVPHDEVSESKRITDYLRFEVKA